MQRFLVLSRLSLLVTLSAGLGCSSSAGDPAQTDVQAAMPEVAKLSGLAILQHPTTAHPVGADATSFSIDGGGQVIVPAGTIPMPTTLRITAVDLGLDKIAFDVKQARAFALETDADFPNLAEPVILEVPVPTRNVSVAQWIDGGWKVMKIEAGPTTRIPIPHFSRSIFSLFEWFSSAQLQVERGLTMSDPRDAINRENAKIERGKEGARAFYGVEEMDGKEGCQEIVDMLATLSDPQAFKFRDLSMQLPSPQAVGQFLHAASTPAQFGGYYHDVVKDSHAAIHQQLTAFPGRASPAEYLKICIDANGGNVPLGVLAAHNYLKDVTYRGRDSWDGGYGMPEDCGQAAAHLRSWREQGNKADGGYYDKMGPLYHVFAGMTATVWGGKILGIAAIDGEAMLRTIRSGSDKPDKSKGRADECGMNIGRWILDREPKDQSSQPSEARPSSYADILRETAMEVGLRTKDAKIDDGPTRFEFPEPPQDPAQAQSYPFVCDTRLTIVLCASPEEAKSGRDLLMKGTDFKPVEVIGADEGSAFGYRSTSMDSYRVYAQRGNLMLSVERWVGSNCEQVALQAMNVLVRRLNEANKNK